MSKELREQEIINRNNIFALNEAIKHEKLRIDIFKTENDGLRASVAQLNQELNALRTQLAMVMASSMGHSTTR